MRKVLFFMSCVIMSSSCYYDVEDELYITDPCQIEDTVSYSDDVAPLIQNSCAVSGCHIASNSANRQNLGDYEGVTVTIDNGSFESYTFINKSMPPSGALDDCDITMLKKWIEQGALNN